MKCNKEMIEKMDARGKGMDIIKKCIVGIMDCLENCVGSMTYVAGQRVAKVFLAAVGMLVFSLVCQAFGRWTVITWQEATCCVIISGVLSLLDESGRGKIGRMVKEVQRRGE